MNLSHVFSAALFAALCSHAAAPLSLLEAKTAPSSAQVSAASAAEGLTVTVQPGDEGYPGITLTPPDKPWDLSAYGHVEAKVRNLGAKPVTVCLRVDDDGDWKANPWNAENLYLQPNAVGTVKVIFGHSFGHKPAYKLKPAAITKLLLFAGKTKDAPTVFRVESLLADGPAGETPPVDPNSIRIAPPGGVLLSERDGVAMQTAARDLTIAWSGPKTNGTARLALSSGKKEGSVTFKPVIGRWTLRDGNQLVAALRNDGAAPLTATLTLANDGTKTDPLTVELAPGARQSLTLPFASKSLWNGEDKKSGSHFASDRANVITLDLKAQGTDAASLIVERLAISVAAQTLPAWLGKRPPVEGAWKMTFSDEFEGSAVDTNKWSYYGENYWDKVSHFTKETTYVKDGMAHLKMMKQRGHHNDDPKRPESDYATGFLESYGKFTQRYGYFEARMKLPTQPGVWPAFWMMPDRGGVNEPQWKRSDTKNGGMEFDIMEHLTRWGVNRFNIALHWDGYGKEHKSIGSTSIYYSPDKDGFVTSGLLWTPGEAVFYCQGQEIGRWKTERIMNVPGHIMFTLPAGGWDNDWLDDAKLPTEFLIDSVRVWQQE